MNDLKNGHFLIAAGTVLFLLIMLGAVMTVHMLGVIQGTYNYAAPPEFWAICKWALGASVSILTLGGIAKWRASQALEEECDGCDEPDCICQTEVSHE